jgi:hypothetical protein
MGTARHIHNSIYTRKALAQARESYASYCDVRVQSETGGAKVTIFVKPEHQEHARQIFLEFWNYFLDLSCKQHLSNA